jgi:tRNA-splicing ligase RtcB (3'-phosphate/5'-hydroxy nucleic acid ligase)
VLDRINDFVWEIKADDSIGMKVPVRIYANKRISEYMQKDRTLMQAKNAATLPGMIKNMLVMPDGHEGYGFPIGGVSAFDADSGIISPGAVGYDINCGVRVIKTDLTEKEVRPKLSMLMDRLFNNVPSGVGSTMKLGFTNSDLDRIATEGVGYLIKKGYCTEEDMERTEEKGCMGGADPEKVSDLAKKRGVQQLGTLGAGNHFVEVQKVDKILDKSTGKAFGLQEDQIVIMLHSGSRGYGHQVCSDYLRVLSEYNRKNNIRLPDPELCYAHIGSKEAEDYLKAMCSAINFAFCNRQIMMHFIRKSFEQTFNKSYDELGMELLYDLSHNIAKLEEHTVDGKRMKLYVHRKGATRAFGPGHKDVTKLYRELGQPVLIPGSMGTASYILAGREESMKETFGSSCHGAGRVMSRHQALREIPSNKTLGEMERKHIVLKVRSKKLVSEEAEWAYKNVDDVVASVEGAKISNAVARLVPVGVTKG